MPQLEFLNGLLVDREELYSDEENQVNSEGQQDSADEVDAKYGERAPSMPYEENKDG